MTSNTEWVAAVLKLPCHVQSHHCTAACQCQSSLATDVQLLRQSHTLYSSGWRLLPSAISATQQSTNDLGRVAPMSFNFEL